MKIRELRELLGTMQDQEAEITIAELTDILDDFPSIKSAGMKFSDGMKFNTEGRLRMVRKSDGLYVVGEGMLIPVKDEEEAKQIIKGG